MAFYATFTSTIDSYLGLTPTSFFTILALMVGVYLLVSSFFVSPDTLTSSRNTAVPPSEPVSLPAEPVQLGDVTFEELKAYDGSDPKKPLLMAIRGNIFDVSKGRMFYGPGGPYALFAGRDASRALALMSFDPVDLTGNLEGLSASELEVLEDWEYKFMEKYVKVGQLVTDKTTVSKSEESELVQTSKLESEEAELLRGLEAALGSPLSSEPLAPSPKPLIVIISGPSGVGKDAVIKRLQEVREGMHFVVTATSRAQRPGEIDGKDYYFVTKEKFLSMIDRNELLEYALVYGEYKGIPKQQIRDFMAKGYDIVLRVDIQGAATLRRILGDAAIFIFLVAESEEALVKRLINRRTETSEMMLVRVATAREEVRHIRNFDYAVINAEGKLEESVKLVESIIDAEKAKVKQRFVKI